jgi:hypothetical protein
MHQEFKFLESCEHDFASRSSGLKFSWCRWSFVTKRRLLSVVLRFEMMHRNVTSRDDTVQNFVTSTYIARRNSWLRSTS